MHTSTVNLTDASGRRLASAHVVEQRGHFAGSIDLSSIPPDIGALFEEFEEIVNGQMLALVDEVEERIAALGVRVQFPDNVEASAERLQIFPSSETVSFYVAVRTPPRWPRNVR
jgi:hypothetical protein